jgi:hypothetical protein
MDDFGPKIPTDQLELYNVIGTGELARLEGATATGNFVTRTLLGYLALGYVAGSLVWSKRNRNESPVYRLDSMKAIANWLRESWETAIEIRNRSTIQVDEEIFAAAEAAQRFALDVVESHRTDEDEFGRLGLQLQPLSRAVSKLLPTVNERLSELLLIGIALPGRSYAG